MNYFNSITAPTYVEQFKREHNLQPADVVIVPITAANVAGHHIVYLHGLEFIQNSNNGRNVHRPDIIQLAYDLSKYKRVKRFEGTETERAAALDRAYRIEREGRVYNWNDYNCEDFSSEVQTGATGSSQVINVHMILGLLSLFLIGIGLTKKNKGLTAGGVLLLSLILVAAASRSTAQRPPSKMIFR